MPSLPAWLWVLLAMFAVYRLARFLVYDEGPLGIGKKFRELMGAYDLDENTGEPRTELGRAAACPYCLGMWLAIPAAAAVLLPTLIGNALLVWMGICGAQDFMQSLTAGEKV